MLYISSVFMLYSASLHDTVYSVCLHDTVYSVSLQDIFRQSVWYEYIPFSLCCTYSVVFVVLIPSVCVVLIPSVSILHIHYFKSRLLAGMREPRIYRSWPRSRHASTCLQERNNLKKASKINYKKTLTEATSIKK